MSSDPYGSLSTIISVGIAECTAALFSDDFIIFGKEYIRIHG